MQRTLPVLPDQTIRSASGRPGGDRDTLSPTSIPRLHFTNRQTSKTQDSNNYKTSKTPGCSSPSQSHLIRQYSLPQETLGGLRHPNTIKQTKTPFYQKTSKTLGVAASCSTLMSRLDGLTLRVCG